MCAVFKCVLFNAGVWLEEPLAIELGDRTTSRYLHEQDYHLRAPGKV